MNQKSKLSKKAATKTTIVIWVLIGVILLIAAAGVVQYLNLRNKHKKLRMKLLPVKPKRQ